MKRHRKNQDRYWEDLRLSIVIPCGGHHARFIGDAVQSCLEGTVRPNQIIVIDDCADPPVNPSFGNGMISTLLCPEHVGRSRARNIGVHHTTCPWIFFLDADDKLEPTAISDFYEQLGRQEFDLLYADYEFIDRNGDRKRVPSRAFRRNWLSLSTLCNIGMFVRRDRFLRIGGFNERMVFAEYHDFFIRYVMSSSVTVVKNWRPLFLARAASSVENDASRSLRSATVQIRHRFRKGEYRKWATV